MAANVLGRIAVTLGLDSAAFEQGLSKAAKQANANAKEIEKGFKGLGGSFDALLGPLGNLGTRFSSTLAQIGNQIGAVTRQLAPLGPAFVEVGIGAAAVGTGLALIGTAAVGMAISGAKVIEEIEHLSEKTGISRENLVAWKAAAEASGVSLDEFTIGLRFFEKSLGGTSAAAKEIQVVLKSIGVTTKDPQEALLQIADAFSKMDDVPRKAAISIALFGRAGTQMIPVLDEGRAGMEKWQQIAKQIGPDISESAVKAAQAWKTANVEIGLRLDALKVSASGLLTVLVDIANAGLQVIHYGLHPYYDPTMPGATADYAKERAKLEEDNTTRMNDLAQKAVDIAKTHGVAAAAVLDLQRQITASELNTTQAGLLHTADLMNQLPALQKAAELERARAAEMQRQAEVFKRSLADLEATHGAIRPGAAKSILKAGDTSGLFGAQPSPWDVLAGEAPSIGGMPTGGAQFGTSGLSLLTSLTEQYKTYIGQTTEEITAYWDSQIKAMDALLVASHASQEVIDEMNKEANSLKANALASADTEAMKAAKAAVRDGTANFQQSWTVAFDNVKKGGANLAQTLGTALGTMIDDINHGLAELIVTGKGLNFKEIAQKFAITMVQSVLQKGESALLGALGFGKPDGSSTKPFYVTLVGPGGMVGSLAGGGGLGSIFGGSGGLGGIFSLFGGFLAGGGDATPGQSYIVGESGPELFTPARAGTVAANSTLRASSQVIYNIDARGADAGVEQRLHVAIRESENRAVARSVSTVNELSKRR
jgi:vacuolar-type H+-ATPase subunit H